MNYYYLIKSNIYNFLKLSFQNCCLFFQKFNLFSHDTITRYNINTIDDTIDDTLDDNIIISEIKDSIDDEMNESINELQESYLDKLDLLDSKMNLSVIELIKIDSLKYFDESNYILDNINTIPYYINKELELFEKNIYYLLQDEDIDILINFFDNLNKKMIQKNIKPKTYIYYDNDDVKFKIFKLYYLINKLIIRNENILLLDFLLKYLLHNREYKLYLLLFFMEFDKLITILLIEENSLNYCSNIYLKYIIKNNLVSCITQSINNKSSINRLCYKMNFIKFLCEFSFHAYDYYDIYNLIYELNYCVRNTNTSEKDFCIINRYNILVTANLIKELLINTHLNYILLKILNHLEFLIIQDKNKKNKNKTLLINKFLNELIINDRLIKNYLNKNCTSIILKLIDMCKLNIICHKVIFHKKYNIINIIIENLGSLAESSINHNLILKIFDIKLPYEQIKEIYIKYYFNLKEILATNYTSNIIILIKLLTLDINKSIYYYWQYKIVKTIIEEKLDLSLIHNTCLYSQFNEILSTYYSNEHFTLDNLTNSYDVAIITIYVNCFSQLGYETLVYNMCNDIIGDYYTLLLINVFFSHIDIVIRNEYSMKSLIQLINKNNIIKYNYEILKLKKKIILYFNILNINII